ncbi:hypothetical protein HOY82DRAFT_596105 [Tuber indicum]|nr:hypothetical protein HOY82DRAFT_596105 [Tuber indicum]
MSELCTALLSLTTGALDAAHAGRGTLMVLDLRLGGDVKNVIARKPDRVILEEQRCHVNAPASPTNRPPNDDNDVDDE